MTLLEDWLSLTDRLLEAGVAVMSTGVVDLTEESRADPKVLCLLLLTRTMSHVKAVRALAKVGRTLEARILVRNCFENSFYVARLANDGHKFVMDMLEDEKKRRVARGQLLFEHQLEFEAETEAKLRQWMKDHKDWTKGETLNPKGISKKTAIEKSYVFYSELSVDAHPSTDTLSRYLLPADEHGRPGIDLEPPLNPAELVDTLNLNACAMLGVLFGVNEVMEAQASQQLTDLANDYQTLERVSRLASEQPNMLGAFFDDSGTHDGSPVVAMGGLLGTAEHWGAFAEQWAAILKEPLPGRPPLTQFHLSHCRNGTAEFAGFSQAERDHLTFRFRRVILDNELITVASVVDKGAWDELVTGEVAEQLESPLSYCFYKCVESVSNIIRFMRPGDPVVMFFDQGTQDRLGEFARFLRTQKDQFPQIAGISFAPVKEVIALQGADMIAYESFLFGQGWLEHGEATVANAHFQEYVKRELSAGLIMMREHIEEMICRVRETIAKKKEQ
jgi:hypothetical protein